MSVPPEGAGHLTTYLKANTFSYLCTKFTAGIWFMTTSHPSKADIDKTDEGLEKS